MPDQSDAKDGAQAKTKAGSGIDRIVDGSLCGRDPMSSAMPLGDMRVPGGARTNSPVGSSSRGPGANPTTPSERRRGQDRVIGGSAT